MFLLENVFFYFLHPTAKTLDSRLGRVLLSASRDFRSAAIGPPATSLRLCVLSH